MTLQELVKKLQAAQWFQRLGAFVPQSGFVVLESLAPWAGGGSEYDYDIADRMTWLPTARDQKDPLRTVDLQDVARREGMESQVRQASLEAYKTALVSLRSMPKCSMLRVGPHDFTEAAKGGALYTARRAAMEVTLGDEGIWCRLLDIYVIGHWPCGVLPDGTIVVL